MTDICIRHPEYCKASNKFEYSNSFGSGRVHKRDFIITETEIEEVPTNRRFGIREQSLVFLRFQKFQLEDLVLEKFRKFQKKSQKL